MPIPVRCPGCAARLNAPDAAAGKRVKCPKCQAAIRIPALAPPPDDIEVEDDTPPAPKPRPAAKAPAVRSRPVVAEDDEDGRPRKRKRPTKKKVPVGLIAGAVLLLGGAAFAAYWFVIRDGDDKPVAVQRSGPPAPGGAGPGPDNPASPPATPAKGLLPLDSVGYLAVSADGRHIAAFGSADGSYSLRVIGPAGVRELRRPPRSSEGPVAFSPDGKTLAAYLYPQVAFWNVETGAPGASGTTPQTAGGGTMPSHLTFTADGSAVVLVTDQTLVTVRAADGAVTAKKPESKPDGASVYVPALDRVLYARPAAGGQGHELAAWDPASDGPPTVVPLPGITDYVGAFAVSADGKTVAVCPNPSDNKTVARVTFHDVATGKETGRVPADDRPKFRKYGLLALSADGGLLAAANRGIDGDHPLSLDLFRVADGTRVHRTAGEADRRTGAFAGGLTFTPDGKALYYVRGGRTLTRVDTASGAAAAVKTGGP